MAFRVARRLGGVPAGAAAAGAYAVAPWMLRNSAMGNSEGLLVALGLAAVDRHLAGRTRHAFLFGLGAALLRPEAWPFIGLYGVWLFWRDPGARRLVAAAFVALPVLWLLPELWGSGDLLRAAHRAHNPRANSAAFSDDPIREVVRQFGAMLTPALWAGLGALVAMMALRLGSGRRERRAALGLALAAAVWVGEVAVMTNDGFSGNSRYLIMPAAVVCVLAGTGLGWLIRALPARWFGERIRGRGGLRRGRRRLRRAEREPPRRGPCVGLLPGPSHRRPRGRHRAGRWTRSPEGLRDGLHRRLPGALRGLAAQRAHDERALRQRARRRPAPGACGGAAVADDERQLPGSADRQHRRRGGREDVRDLRRLAHRGALRVSAAAPSVTRPRARIARLGTARLAVSLPKSLLVLAFLVGLSLALRTQAIHARFWIDEGLSVGISSHPLGDIPGVLRKDGSPPLYYLILKLWMSVFGSGEADTHALSVAFAIFTVPAAWLGGRALFGDRAAWIAALLAAINPFLTYYSQETRMYALVALLSTVVTATFVVTFVQGRRAWLPVFSVSLALIAYAHNWGLFLAVGTVAALVPIWRQAADRRAVVRDALLAYAITAVLYLPWLPILISQAKHTGAPWAEAPDFQDILNGLANLCGGAAPAMAFALGAGFGLSTILAGAAALSARPGGALGGHHGRHGPGARVAGLAGLAGLVEPLLLGLRRPGAAPRRRRAGPRRPAGPRRHRDPRRLLVQPAHRSARHQEQRPHGRRPDPRPPRAQATWSSPSTPSRVRSCTTTCPRTSGCAGPMRWARSTTRWSSTGATRWTASRRPSRRPPSDSLVATLKPGQKILAIFPIIRTARWGAPWTSEVRKRSAQWQRVLDRDKRLSRTLVAPVTEGKPLPKGVRAVLYERK